MYNRYRGVTKKVYDPYGGAVFKSIISKIIFIVAIVLLFPTFSDAGYIIYLKNGRQITVNSYWVEGNEIKYSVFGGVMGINKGEVLSIKEMVTSPYVIEKTSLGVSPPTPLSTKPEDQGKVAELEEKLKEIDKKIEEKKKVVVEFEKELARPKYTRMIRKERELKGEKDRISKEITELESEKEKLLKELNTLKSPVKGEGK
ncbi:MAG: hypothetical protein AB1488_03700 [Nitrospirota bacterium]